MAKGCTGGETATGVLMSKETVSVLRGVFENERAKTATKDKKSGANATENKVFGFRTQ